MTEQQTAGMPISPIDEALQELASTYNPAAHKAALSYADDFAKSRFSICGERVIGAGRLGVVCGFEAGANWSYDSMPKDQAELAKAAGLLPEVRRQLVEMTAARDTLCKMLDRASRERNEARQVAEAAELRAEEYRISMEIHQANRAREAAIAEGLQADLDRAREMANGLAETSDRQTKAMLDLGRRLKAAEDERDAYKADLVRAREQLAGGAQ